MVKMKMANVKDWAKLAKDRQLAVAKISISEVAQQANLTRAKGGRMPVITSTLRGSFTSSLNGQQVGRGEPETHVILAINKLEAGDVASFGWTAAYARRVNSGFVGEDRLGRYFNQSGAYFMEFGTDQWKALVAEAVKKVNP